MGEPLLLAAFAAFFGGALFGGVIFERFFARRTVDRIIGHLEALIERRPEAKAPRALRDQTAAKTVQRLAARLADVESLATFDQLTGLFNRPASLRHLESELTRASRHARPISVALVDLDHFKQVNDVHGHVAGDVVLRQVAQQIRSELRASDIVGRYGGEEFLVVLPETDEEGAVAVVEKLRRLVGRTPVALPDGSELAITMSIGLAVAQGSDLTLDGITSDADAALYTAKAMGRNQVNVFRAADDQRLIRRLALTPGARDAAVDIGRRAAMAAQDQLVEVLAPRPGWAGRPSELIAELSVHVADAMGLPDSEVLRIRTASLLHDVGKVAIPEALLSKPTQLSDTEWRAVMEHPRIGQIVLEQAGAMRDASTIALHHHEWFNGQGYPHGLAGNDIPLGARIVAIADAYEAMTSWRPYQPSRTHEEALAEIRRCAGTQFDPTLVELFIASFPTQLVRDAGDALRTGTDG